MMYRSKYLRQCRSILCSQSVQLCSLVTYKSRFSMKYIRKIRWHRVWKVEKRAVAVILIRKMEHNEFQHHRKLAIRKSLNLLRNHDIYKTHIHRVSKYFQVKPKSCDSEYVISWSCSSTSDADQREWLWILKSDMIFQMCVESGCIDDLLHSFENAWKSIFILFQWQRLQRVNSIIDMFMTFFLHWYFIIWKWHKKSNTIWNHQDV